MSYAGHSFGRPPQKSSPAADKRVPQSDTGGAAAHARNPAAHAQGTTRTTSREISRTHRSDRGNREQRSKGSGADPQSTRQGSARRNGHPRTSQGDRPLL